MRKRHTLVGMEYDEAMRCALELAGQAAAAGDVPVGAVVLDAAGQIVGRGYNTRDPHIGHSPEVHGGVLEGECQSILTDFFAQRR